MLVLRLLVMVLAVMCLMDGQAEVSSSTTGIRNGGESSDVETKKPEVQILDRKKKKKGNGKKKKGNGKKSKGKKPNQSKPASTTTKTTISTITTKTSTLTTTTTETTTRSTTTTSTTTTITTSTSPTTTSSTTTTSSSTTAKTTTTAATTAESGAGEPCEATNGSPCIFPFKDGNNEYNECKNHGGIYFWCATTIYESGKYKHWSYCPLDGSCPLEGDGECRATNKKPCVFPFKDGNQEYNECADFNGKYFWCATGTNSAGKFTSWSKCPEDGSCPLPEKSTTPVATSPATTASMTGTTTATNEMEKKVLGTLENLILGESRDDSLELAYMLNKTLDNIIKDLEGETSKRAFVDDNGELLPVSEEPNILRRLDEDEHVRDETRMGKGLMFDLSTVASMKSVSRVSDDCCSDCKEKHSYTELAEYWDTLGACFCYKKKLDSYGVEVVPQTWASSEFTTKTCEPSGCGYNSDVDRDRLLAEQNSAYLLNMMADQKYTDVFEVLNWNQGFANPKINYKLFQDLENRKGISSGYYMMFLAPANVVCDKLSLDNPQKSLFPFHISQFSNTKRANEALDTLVTAIDGKEPEWLKTVYKDKSPHICMALQTTYFFVAINRVQTITDIFNFAFESERHFLNFIFTEINENRQIKENSDVKIVLKESQSTRLLVRSELPDSIERLMEGAIKIESMSWKNNRGNSLGIDGKTLKDLNKPEFNMFKDMYVAWSREVENGFDLVEFEEKPKLPMVMETIDDIFKTGQTTLVGGLATTFFPGEYADINGPAIYLPWMQDTITMRKLDSNFDYAFTAQINSCGIRIFTIKDSAGYGSFDGTYLSHDNKRTLKNIPILSDDAFKERLNDAGIIQKDPNLKKTEIKFLAKIVANDPFEDEPTRPLVPCYAGEDGKAVYASYFNERYTYIQKEPEHKFYIGKSTAIAIQKGKGSANAKWCLALQRNIIVRDSKKLKPKPIVSNKPNKNKDLVHPIFGNDMAIVSLDIEQCQILMDKLEEIEEILVTRPFLNGEFGYEMICEGEKGTFHEVDSHAQNEINFGYWSKAAKIVDCTGLGGNHYVFITNDILYQHRTPKLKDLFNYMEIDSGMA